MSYDALLPKIDATIFEEYKAAQSAYNLLPGTRLVEIGVATDCSIFLSYGLYFYYEASKSIDMLDHEIVVTMQQGRITDVMFAG